MKSSNVCTLTDNKTNVHLMVRLERAHTYHTYPRDGGEFIFVHNAGVGTILILLRKLLLFRFALRSDVHPHFISSSNERTGMRENN